MRPALLAVLLCVPASAQPEFPRPSQIPLTADAAASLALDRSPALRAARARARAESDDARAAGRPEDPRFTGAYKGGRGDGRTEVGLTFDVWSLAGMSARRRAGRAEAARADAAAAQRALDLAADAKAAVYEVQADSAVLALHRENAAAAAALAELAAGQRRAGNIAALDADVERAAAAQAALEVDRAEADLSAARSRLARLMRVPTEAGWWTTAGLPQPPPSDPALDELKAAARRRRPTRVAAQSLASAARERAAAPGPATLGSARLGFAAEREPEGNRLAGPALEMDLPLFGGPAARREAADARAAEAAALADEEDAASDAEVESLRARLDAARRAAARYRDEIVPARARIVEETQLRYNGMLSGADRLLGAKQAETDARHGLVEALRDYWTTRAALERATGGPL